MKVLTGMLIVSLIVFVITLFFVLIRNRKDYFYFKGKGRIYVKNLDRGLIAIGGAGSGKTYSFIKPILAYCIKKRGCITFDPKGELTSLINQKAKEFNKDIINFSLDENYDKINPIALCKDKSDVIEFSSYFLSGIVGQPKEDNAKYFFNAAKSVLTGVIIFLKNKGGKYATIPHFIALFLTVTPKELIAILTSDEEARRASMVLNSVKEDPKLLGSIISTFTAFFASLDTPRIFRNLVTAQELNIPNNPKNPSVINLIFNLQKRDLYTPIYSSIIGLILKRMNTENQYESAIIVDEFTVLSIPNFVNIPETARSNKIATCIAIQDLSQLITKYGKDVASSIVSNMGSQFLFRTTNPETLEHFEKMLGKREVENKSKTTTDFSIKTSNNRGLKEVNILRKEKVIKYKPGQVFAVIAEGNRSLVENIRINGNHYLRKKVRFKDVIPGDECENQRVYLKVYSEIDGILKRKTITPKKFNL